MRWRIPVLLVPVVLGQGCVAAVDGGPSGDGAPRAHPTEADATAAQAPELVDETGAVTAPAGCVGLLDEGFEPPADGDTDAARSVFQDGTRSFEAGDYRMALQAFCEAYRLSSAEPLLYNIAVCYERIGLHDEAADHYEAFADRQPDDAPLADEVRRRVTALRAR